MMSLDHSGYGKLNNERYVMTKPVFFFSPSTCLSQVESSISNSNLPQPFSYFDQIWENSVTTSLLIFFGNFLFERDSKTSKY